MLGGSGLSTGTIRHRVSIGSPRAVDFSGNIQPAMDDPVMANKRTYWENNGQVTRHVRASGRPAGPCLTRVVFLNPCRITHLRPREHKVGKWRRRFLRIVPLTR